MEKKVTKVQLKSYQELHFWVTNISYGLLGLLVTINCYTVTGIDKYLENNYYMGEPKICIRTVSSKQNSSEEW